MSGRLRILFLAPQPFFEVRGTPLAVLHMTRALGELGHQVDLLTFPQGEAAPTPGVRHLRSLWLPVGRVKAGPSLAKMLLDVPFAAEMGRVFDLSRDGSLALSLGTDRALRLWDTSTGDVVYDNNFGASDDIDVADPQTISGGSIVIHK